MSDKSEQKFLMEQRPELPETPRRKFGIGLRFLMVGTIIPLMLIPMAFIDSLVRERSDVSREVKYEITSSWGREQEVVAPFITLPIKRQIVQKKQTKVNGVTKIEFYTSNVMQTLIILPAQLNIDVQVDPQTRKRGIYNTLLYTADLKINGSFNLKDLDAFISRNNVDGNIVGIYPDKAKMVVQVSQESAVEKAGKLQFGKQEFSFQPGNSLLERADGFHANTPVVEKDVYSFQFTMRLRGSEYLALVPVAQENNFEMRSSWPHPSFQGFLPSDKNISEKGFHAKWNISSLSTGISPYILLYEKKSEYDRFSFFSKVAKTKLFQPVSIYTTTDRAMKYSILFISLTFLIFLIFEIVMKSTRFAGIQYGLVGIAMSMFYLLLLSFAEHIGFLGAYIVASFICIALISGYVLRITKSSKYSSIMCACLVSFYGLMYFILRMEDYALLAGSLLTVAVLGVLMAVTGNLNQNSGSSEDSLFFKIKKAFKEPDKNAG